ncbi:hypothetical protein [Zavarzinia sp. CC-PAN008]|uniref:hypothetical protein n=1 Tax=Zavarzinia sp. CC-PAN008 TaxID=3243332 RepID=UPI003F747673
MDLGRRFTLSPAGSEGDLIRLDVQTQAKLLDILKQERAATTAPVPWAMPPRVQVKAELAPWLCSRLPTHMVTLSFESRMATLSQARDVLRVWDSRMNRTVYGQTFYRDPAKRLKWAAFLEGIDGFLHWHVLLTWPAHTDKDAATTAYACWLDALSRVRLQGKANIRLIDDRLGIVSYCAKQYGDASDDGVNYDRLVLSEDFSNSN